MRAAIMNRRNSRTCVFRIKLDLNRLYKLPPPIPQVHIQYNHLVVSLKGADEHLVVE